MTSACRHAESGQPTAFSINAVWLLVRFAYAAFFLAPRSSEATASSTVCTSPN